MVDSRSEPTWSDSVFFPAAVLLSNLMFLAHSGCGGGGVASLSDGCNAFVNQLRDSVESTLK